MNDVHFSCTELGTRILKVNHAGEHGAVNIYSGQLLAARLTAHDMLAELQEFKSHEEGHRAIFFAELRVREQQRCRSYFLCAIGGFLLGFVTGLFGRGAIAATTVAVERVVLRHLTEQVHMLRESDPAAARAISAIVTEEQQHYDRSAKHLTAGRCWPIFLSPVVSISTEAVIWLGMRI